MPFDTTQGFSDKDALHILPLSTIPLESARLRRARLVKNARLEGMVELFSDAHAGSGQIQPTALSQFLDNRGKNSKDVTVVQELSRLPSYDVYSLRIQLRRLGIDVENHSKLTMSDKKISELTPYMTRFIRPLIRRIYGSDEKTVGDMKQLLALLESPDVDFARKNIIKLSKDLGIDVLSIPAFLKDYGDTYLSLSYYQCCLDDILPAITAFFGWLRKVKGDRNFRSNTAAVQTCAHLEERIRNFVQDLSSILDMFKTQTEDLWENVSPDYFKHVKRTVNEYKVSMGGGLCAVTVKMSAWNQLFPSDDIGPTTKRVDFIMSDLKYGIDKITQMKYQDVSYMKRKNAT